jgi:hypothetical protein
MKRLSSSRSFTCFVAILSLIASTAILLGAAGQEIRILSPKKDARVSGEISVDITARLADPIAYVLLLVDGEATHSTNSSPYAIDLDTTQLSDGPHLLQALAHGRYTLLAQSASVRIYVKNQVAVPPPAAKPTKQITASKPAEGKPAPSSAPPAKARPLTTASAALAQLPAPHSAGSTAASPEPLKAGPRPEPSPQPALPSPQAAPQPATAPAPPSPAGIGVALSGRPLVFDVPPVLRSGRMEVPFRPLLESLGAQVNWHPSTRTAAGRSPRLQLELPVGQPFARVNGHSFDLGQKLVIRHGRVIVPLRRFADTIGLSVSYDSELRTALLNTSSSSPHLLAVAPSPQ